MIAIDDDVRSRDGLVAVTADGEAAMQTAEALLAAGLSPRHIGLVGKDEGAMRAGLDAIGFPVKPSRDRPDDLARHLEPAGRDELVGAALGSCAGLAVGLGPFLIPGLGPLLFAYGGLAMLGDALLTTALGAGIGAFFGALFEHRVAHGHRERWRQALKDGAWLVVVRGDQDELARAEAVFAEAPIRHLDAISA